jgi:hypothetical protein
MHGNAVKAASIIDWMLVLEVEDVNGACCVVDDMKKLEVLDNLGIGVGGNGLQWRGGKRRGLGKGQRIIVHVRKPCDVSEDRCSQLAHVGV